MNTRTLPNNEFGKYAGAADSGSKVARTGFDTAFGGPANAFSIRETGLMPKFQTDKGPNLELRCNLALTPWLRISPDFQYIFNPAGAAAGSAVVIGLRVQIVF